jgi:hypothetical protein
MPDPDRNQDPRRPPHPGQPPRRMSEKSGRGRRIGIVLIVILVAGTIGWLLFGTTVPRDDTLGEPAGFGVAAPSDAEPGETVGPGETHSEEEADPPFARDGAADDGAGDDGAADQPD